MNALDERVHRYVSRCYSVVSRTPTSASLVKPKRFGCLPFALLLLLGLLPGLLYLSYHASKRDDVRYLSLEHGRVVESRPRRLLERGSAAGWGEIRQLPPRAQAVLILGVGATILIVLLYFGSRDDVGSQSIDIPASTGVPSPEASPGRASAYQQFRGLLESEASCERLFAARSRIAESSPDYRRANDDLRTVGCSSSASTRTDVAGTAPAPFSIQDYRLSYAQCSTRGEQIDEQAGTRDPRRAAEWLSSAIVRGPQREGSIAGCFDALTGEPSRHED